jgi:nucleoside-diphosphate-sugar epimerase
MLKRIFVPGGAGYVGSVLVPALLAQGYEVSVLDLMLYGDDTLAPHPRLSVQRGDVRDGEAVRRAVEGCDGTIHLACISNDPSVELDPELSRSVNLDSFHPLVKICKEAGVRRFVFASSSSIYGVSDSPDVTEEHPLVPVSLYNRYKAACEPLLLQEAGAGFEPVIARPATLCGTSPRQRLDLTVNILTNHAVNAGKITVFGGSQMRPNMHMKDMVALYLVLLEAERAKVHGEIFNAGYQNLSVLDTALLVQRVVGAEMPERRNLEIVTTPSDDIRSYHVSAEKARRVLGFTASFTIEDAVRDLVQAFQAGKIPDSLSSDRYYNVKWMKAVQLT